jgi:hypothetical protein
VDKRPNSTHSDQSWQQRLALLHRNLTGFLWFALLFLALLYISLKTGAMTAIPEGRLRITD